MKLSEVTSTKDFKTYIEDVIYSARGIFGTGVVDLCDGRSISDRRASFLNIRGYVIEHIRNASNYNDSVKSFTSKIEAKDFTEVTNACAEDVGMWVRFFRRNGVLSVIKSVNRLRLFMAPVNSEHNEMYYNIQGQPQHKVANDQNSMFIKQFANDFNRIMSAGCRLHTGKLRKNLHANLSYNPSDVVRSVSPEISICQSPVSARIRITAKTHKDSDLCALAVSHLNAAFSEMNIIDDINWVLKSQNHAEMNIKLVREEQRIETPNEVPVEKTKTPSSPIEISLSTIKEQLTLVQKQLADAEAEYTKIAAKRSLLNAQANTLKLARDQLQHCLNKA